VVVHNLKYLFQKKVSSTKLTFFLEIVNNLHFNHSFSTKQKNILKNLLKIGLNIILTIKFFFNNFKKLNKGL